MLKFNPTTPVKFYAKTTEYIPGQGQTSTWALVKSGTYDTFYCEWTGTFGERALRAQALGVSDSATVRTFYAPALCEKLRTEQVVVIKTPMLRPSKSGVPDKNNPNVYELWGGVDNVLEKKTISWSFA